MMFRSSFTEFIEFKLIFSYYYQEGGLHGKILTTRLQVLTKRSQVFVFLCGQKCKPNDLSLLVNC